jgi:uncharacterized LabA/DUF88 family protein
MHALFLVDHDNIPHADGTIKSVLTSWLRNHIVDARRSAVYVDIRAYGGWFDGLSVTQSRFAAADFYQRTSPTVILHDGVICRMSFQFADTLLAGAAARYMADSAPLIAYTVVTRSSPLYVRTRTSQRDCGETGCELHNVRKWISKRRACHNEKCPHAFGDYFVRTEQKQVDVHLAVDLVRACLGHFDHIVLVSEDWDLLPALLGATELCNSGQVISVVRFRPGVTYLDSVLIARSVHIITAVGLDQEAPQ